MDERVRAVNNGDARPGGRYVLYWMRANRRATFNHALAFAAELANERGLPLLCFESEASGRQRDFVREGSRENARRLRALGAGYVFGECGRLAELAEEAALLVTDEFPRLPDPDAPIACYAIDSSCIVPMSRIPGRQYAAYAIRPKIRKLLPRYLRPVEPVRLRRGFHGAAEDCPAGAGGALAAEAALDRFLEHGLRRYARHRNDPTAHAVSGLSPYLHHGHISSLEVALKVGEYAERHKLMAGEFLEELIVRRELAFNFAQHAARVDSLDELPEWARKTLACHARDPRPVTYSREDFVRARTHDTLWNAAQKEMLARGVIHGYCRMYWGKKLLEWSATYEEALAAALEIHDRYALDGRDPNTWANILWCFGLHDRPWPERPIYGLVRSMTRQGVERKFDVAAYIREMEAL
jgi:deoxyribodipyrimidine photo-lyase